MSLPCISMSPPYLLTHLLCFWNRGARIYGTITYGFFLYPSQSHWGPVLAPWTPSSRTHHEYGVFWWAGGCASSTSMPFIQQCLLLWPHELCGTSLIHLLHLIPVGFITRLYWHSWRPFPRPMVTSHHMAGSDPVSFCLLPRSHSHSASYSARTFSRLWFTISSAGISRLQFFFVSSFCPLKSSTTLLAFVYMDLFSAHGRPRGVEPKVCSKGLKF